MGLSREMCKIGIDRRPRVDAKPAFTAVEDKATVETGPSAMVVFLGGAVLRSVAFYRSPENQNEKLRGSGQSAAFKKYPATDPRRRWTAAL